MDELEKVVRIEALKNALKYENAQVNSVMGKIMAEKPEFRSRAKDVIKTVKRIVNEINEWDEDKQKKMVLDLDPHALDEEESKPEEKTLPELPNAKIGDKDKPVVMRLAPYPSGALHIGNARMIVLNDEYVKNYKGKLILCFDDTIGTTLKRYENNRDKAKFVLPEAYDLIIDGLEWLGVEFDRENIVYKSDRVEIYKQYAEKCVKEDHAYVCTCAPGVFSKKYKRPGKECPCRSLSVDENLVRWNQMLDGTYGEGEAVVRLKTGMDQKDPAVRDHIIMRISDAVHPRIGKKTRVWPLLDFSWAIDDHELGITHIIRGVDLRKEGFIENFIWDLMGWEKAEILLYGRLQFSSEYKLSKTESRVKIQSGEYDGWDDPRTWSLQSLRARGIKSEALRESLLDLGMSNSSINFSEDWIYAKNTKIIDDDAERYWFVENPVEIEISGLDKDKYLSEPLLNPNDESLGTREVKVSVSGGKCKLFIAEADTEVQKSRKGNKVRYPQMIKGTQFRLKDLFTVEIDEINGSFDNIRAHFLTEEFDQDIRKIQWVPANDYVDVKVLKPNGIVMKGLAESNVGGLEVGSIIQFERYGYVKINTIQENEIKCYFAH